MKSITLGLMALYATILLLLFPVLTTEASSSSLQRQLQHDKENEDSSSRSLTSRVSKFLRRLDNDDINRINEILVGALPSTNWELRDAMPDPLPLNLSATVGMGCGTLVLDLEFDELVGLSSVNLNKNEAQVGTDSKSSDCWSQTIWRALLDSLVVFDKDLVAGQIFARLRGRCNGVNYNQPLGASARSVGTQFSGTANAQGSFGTFANAVADVEYLGTLTLTSTAIPVTLGAFPQELSQYYQTALGQVGAAFRQQLVKEVEPFLREELEDAVPSSLFSTVGYLLRESVPFLEDLLGDSLNDTPLGDISDTLDDLGDIFGTEDDEYDDDEDDDKGKGGKGDK